MPPLLAHLGCLARNPKQQLKADRDSTCSELFNTQLHLKNHGFQSLGAATRHRHAPMCMFHLRKCLHSFAEGVHEVLLFAALSLQDLMWFEK